MPYVIPQPTRQELAPYVVHKEMFSKEECAELIAMHKGLKKSPPMIGNGNVAKTDKAKRSADLYWIDWDPSKNALFAKIADKVVGANNKWWGFNLCGLNEALQLTHYRAKDKGHYDWHEDWAEAGTFSIRKISGVILLSDKFSGGEFEFLSGEAKDLTMGSMILFPSFKTHRVKPVLKGDRWSLVFWVTGPPFA